MKPFRSRFITFGLTVGLFIQFGLPVLPQKDSSNASTPVTERSQAGVTPRRESETVALKELIEEALDRNPEIRSMQRSFDMMRARVPQAKALPDPMLEFGYMGNVTPVPPFDIQKGDPSSARMVSFSQEIPFPGKLSLKGRMAEAEAQSEWWAYEQLLLNVASEVKDDYYELYFLDKAIEIVVLSGHLAARALIEGKSYNRLWRSRLGGLVRTSIVNRYFFERLGELGYSAFMRRIATVEIPREWLRRHYAPLLWKRLWAPVARRAVQTRRRLSNALSKAAIAHGADVSMRASAPESGLRALCPAVDRFDG